MIERQDTYYGWQPVTVQPFRTKRKGVLVTRYRLVAAAGGWYSPNSFISRKVAEHALWEASVHGPLFRETVDAGAAVD